MMVGSGVASLLFFVVVTVVLVVVELPAEVFDPLVVVVTAVPGVLLSTGAAVTDVVVDDEAEAVVSAAGLAVGAQPARTATAPSNETFDMPVIACSALSRRPHLTAVTVACAAGPSPTVSSV
jgi:hypothetical protein